MARGNGARNRRRARRERLDRVVQPGVRKAPVQDTFGLEPAGRALEELAVSGSTSLPLGDRGATWDAAAADKAVRSWAGAEDAPNAKYGQAFFWHAADPAGFGDYKLGFAEPSGGTLTANWGGVTAAAGAVQGARGGVKIPSGDVAAVKGRIEGYYAKAAEKYKDDGITPPWKAAAEASIRFAEENGLDLLLNGAGEYAGMGGDFDPVALVAVQDMAASLALAQAELGPDADPAVVAVAALAWRDSFAAMPACSNCDHAYTAHLGLDGPCTAEDCSCTSYSPPEVPSDEVEEDARLVSTAYVRILPNLDGFREKLTGEVAEAVKDVLARFELTDFEIESGFAETDTLPPDHQPGETLPPRAPTVAPPEVPASGAEVQWSAIFAPEGKLTSDGRAFAPGSITWRELPLTLMAMTETSEGGHVGAQVAGRIDRIWRDEAAALIRAQGVFNDTEYGSLIASAAVGVPIGHVGEQLEALRASLVQDETLRGVSVDLAIHKYDVGPRSDWFDENGNWAPKAQASEAEEPDLVEILFGGEDAEPSIAVVLEAEIGMTTVCPFPAFAEAKIAVGDSLVAGANPAIWTVTQQAGWTAVSRPLIAPLTPSESPEGLAVTDPPASETEALTASAAGLAPVRPPAEWFADPQLEEATGIVVTEEGRIYGHAAVWGVCHIGLPGQCRTAPHSQTGYQWFHLGEVLCADGERVPCGQVTLDAPHADRDLGRAAATAHYDHTGTVAAHVVVGEDDHGIWVAGAIQPDLPEAKARILRGSKLSGDWRKIDGNLELVALLCVNVPGFPVPRARALVAAIDGNEEVMTLVAAGIPVFDADLTADELERFRALSAHAEFTALLNGTPAAA